MSDNEYKKDFWLWHGAKEKINQHDKSNVFFYEREIWFCSLGVNVGHEQDGTSKDLFERPVLVLKKFNEKTFWGIPITSNKKCGKYYYQFRCKNRIHSLILSQMRLFDSKRLTKKFASIEKIEFSCVKNRIIEILK